MARTPAKYPGWRTMTGAQRYNARMARIFDDAYARARAEGRASPWDEDDPHGPLCASRVPFGECTCGKADALIER